MGTFLLLTCLTKKRVENTHHLGKFLAIIQLLFRTDQRASERETSIDRVKKVFPASFQVMADGS